MSWEEKNIEEICLEDQGQSKRWIQFSQLRFIILVNIQWDSWTGTGALHFWTSLHCLCYWSPIDSLQPVCNYNNILTFSKEKKSCYLFISFSPSSPLCFILLVSCPFPVPFCKKSASTVPQTQCPEEFTLLIIQRATSQTPFNLILYRLNSPISCCFFLSTRCSGLLKSLFSKGWLLNCLTVLV